VTYVTIEERAEGQRMDNFLLARVKGVPRSRIYRLLRRGEVRVNKGRVKPDYRLRKGDLVRIPPVRTSRPDAPSSPPATLLERLEASILYEDDRLLAVNKPAGLAVHGGSGISHGLIEAMRVLRPAADLELVHRLDRDTSGCLVLTKRRSALRELHRLIRANAVEKRYIALLAGTLSGREIRVQAPLLKNTLKSGERVVRVDDDRGKPALTLIRVRRRYGRLTLVEADLITGRTHQIRVHAAHVGAPVAGDSKYGGEDVNRDLRRRGLKRLFLHASALSFTPSFSPRKLRFEAPLPADLVALLETLSK
jgi:23S rRNA pseudouridine955/2504/2580 synthase